MNNNTVDIGSTNAVQVPYVKKVIIDLDSTLFRWGDKLEEIVREKYPNFSMDRLISYDFNKNASKIPFSSLSTRFDRETVQEYIRTGNVSSLLGADRGYILSLMSDTRLYSEVEPYDCIELLRALMESSSFEVIFNTAIPPESYNEVLKAKEQRLKDFFEGYEYTLLTTAGLEKPSFPDAYAVLDDRLEYLCEQLDKKLAETKYFLINQPYNQFIFNEAYASYADDLIRVGEIGQALEFLLNEESIAS